MVSLQKISGNVINSVQGAKFKSVSKPVHSSILAKDLPQWGLPIAASAGAFGVLLNNNKDTQRVNAVQGASYEETSALDSLSRTR